MLKRLYDSLLADHFAHEKNMVFLCGPRQSGKTTTALAYRPKTTSYWNWDDDDERLMLRQSQQKFLVALKSKSPGAKVLVLDEIHKNPKWRNWLKGFYDKHQHNYQIIVSGSARLNVIHRGGDSLLGRYYLYRHHPLSLGELGQTPFATPLFRKTKSLAPTQTDQLLHFGGFPAPFLSARKASHQKWIRTRRELLLREDLRDLSKVEDLAALELLVTLLHTRIGGLLNYYKLSQDVHVSVDTIRRWIKLLDRLYYLYVIPPYSKNIKNSLRKMPKVYLWDWSEVIDEGARFENFIASHLLKSVHYWVDAGLGNFNLYYIRDKQKREVDFLVTQDEKPFLMVEAKWNDSTINPALTYWKNWLKPTYSFQVVKNLKSHGLSFEEATHYGLMAADDFCAALV